MLHVWYHAISLLAHCFYPLISDLPNHTWVVSTCNSKRRARLFSLSRRPTRSTWRREPLDAVCSGVFPWLNSRAALDPLARGRAAAVAMGEFFFFLSSFPHKHLNWPKRPKTLRVRGYVCMHLYVCALFLLTNLKSSSCRKSSSFVDIRCLLQGLLPAEMCLLRSWWEKKGRLQYSSTAFPLFEV